AFEQLGDGHLAPPEGERHPPELAFAGWERPYLPGPPGDPRARDQLAHVLEPPAVKRRILPVRQGDLGLRREWRRSGNQGSGHNVGRGPEPVSHGSRSSCAAATRKAVTSS